MHLEIKSIFSIELDKGEEPESPKCCCVSIRAQIGIRGKEASEQFNFYAITPEFLLESPEVRWGRGYLLLPEFSWNEVERMLERLISGISVDSWQDAALRLNNYLEWEFANYQSVAR